MGESKKTVELCRGLEKLGAMTFAVVGSMRQKPGWPDRWIGHPLWTGWIEFKDWNTPVDPLQRKTINDIQYRWPGGAYIARFGNDGGIAICDGDMTLMASTFAEPETFIATLFALQCGKTKDWVEHRQGVLQSTLDRVVQRAIDRGILEPGQPFCVEVV